MDPEHPAGGGHDSSPASRSAAGYCGPPGSVSVEAPVRLAEVAAVKAAGSDGTLIVDAAGRFLIVSSQTLNKPAAPGDWVMVHSGFALVRLDPGDARDARAIRTGNWEDAEP